MSSPRSTPPLDLILPLLRRHWPRLALGFTALLGVDALQLFIPRLIRQAVDGLDRGTAEPAFLARTAGCILAIALAATVLRFTWRNRIVGLSRIVECRLRERLFAHLLGLDRPFFDRSGTGEVMARFTNDLAAVQLACGMGMVAALDALVMGLASLGFMFAIHPGLCLVAALPMPLLALAMRRLSARLHQRFTAVQEQFGRITEYARASLGAISLVQAAGMETARLRGLEELGLELRRRNMETARIQGLLHPLSGLAGQAGTLLVLWFGGRMVMEGAIGLGDFAAFLAYLAMLSWPMMAVGWVAALYQRGMSSLARLAAFLDTAPLLPSGAAGRAGDRGRREPGKGHGPPAVRQGARFVLRGLSFSYPGTRRPVLQDIHLELGQDILGITGPTGSGKTTLCRVLARLYPVEPGQVFVDGTDICQLLPARVRDLVALVEQESVLFSGTLRENLALARPGATDQDLARVLALAALDHGVQALPQGLETRVGERGVRLSGGQRRRLSLARALLRPGALLIMDDTLAAVDVDTEQRIVDNLRPWLHRAVIVSHRPGILSLARRIAVLEQGRITALGSREEVLGSSAYFRELMRRSRGNDA